MRPPVHLALALSLALPLGPAACSSSSGAGGTAGSGGAACASEPASWPAVPPGTPCVTGVSGRVRELGGAPLGGMLVSVCGIACFGTKTLDDGSFRVPFGVHLAPQRFAIEIHGRPDHGELFLPLPLAGPLEMDVGELAVPLLPPSGVALPQDGAPATTVTAGAVSLEIPAATTWALALEDIVNGASGRTLRVASVPVAQAPAFARDVQPLLIYALAPSSAQPSAKVGVRLAETAGLTPGAAVELHVLVTDYLQMPNLAGTLRLEAKGHVTADGAAIETDAGEGISQLSWIVVRVGG